MWQCDIILSASRVHINNAYSLHQPGLQCLTTLQKEYFLAFHPHLWKRSAFAIILHQKRFVSVQEPSPHEVLLSQLACIWWADFPQFPEKSLTFLPRRGSQIWFINLPLYYQRISTLAHRGCAD